MKCEHCGRYIVDDSVFCEFCGGKVGKNEKSLKMFLAGLLAVGLLIGILAASVNSNIFPQSSQTSSSNTDSGDANKTTLQPAQSIVKEDSESVCLVNGPNKQTDIQKKYTGATEKKGVIVSTSVIPKPGKPESIDPLPPSKAGLEGDSEIGYGTGLRRIVNQISTSVSEEGRVCVEVHVSEDGIVLDARVINNSGKYKTTITNRNIHQQCIREAKRAKYEPGKEELRIIVFS